MNEETKQILKKPFLTNSDIERLLQCSPSKVSRVKRFIKDELTTRGKKLLTHDVPTKLFVEIMNLDVDFEEARQS